MGVIERAINPQLSMIVAFIAVYIYTCVHATLPPIVAAVNLYQL